MIKRKVIMTTLALSLTLGTAFTAFAPLAGAAETTAVFQVKAETGVQEKQVASYNALVGMFSAEKVDLEKVKAEYIVQLQPAVKARNAEIDEKVLHFFDNGIKGSYSKDQVKQAIDKGLQWFFYQEITEYVRIQTLAALDKEDTQAALEALDKGIKLFEGTLFVTAGKRDNGFKTTMQDQFKIIIPELQKAAAAGDKKNFNVYRQYLDKTIIKTFALGTALYAGNIEKAHKEGKTADVAKFMAEGYFFFLPIYNSLAGASKESADAIKLAFESGEGARVTAEMVRGNLAKAINGKVSGYYSATFDNLAKGDEAKALEVAAEGNAFTAAQEVFVKDQLGADVYAKLLENGQLYFEAVKANKVEEAKKLGFENLAILTQLKGVQFGIGEKALTLDGQTVSFNEEVSFLNKETNRTLASARFVAEALGAKVEWVAAENKVVITKADKTIELVVGSTEVVVNGKKDEKTTLDQPVVIQNGRSYIPVRAVSNVLGSKVAYFNGEVIIH
ncbi:copper amine oxidase N-terminal domain-containing protein [Ammoniphilus sp. YIM 78166]|uniref:copper amine oxidase N-terminal domain-containing protein n=1 Tax=Ammoniphilus sp. YIM 78166 TaxID=1644106 RepID=UPI001431B3B4|nr:copper amine oxidase N-terminal domain-containing protein [Ammoniphilus sp. YIM 78166]